KFNKPKNHFTLPYSYTNLFSEYFKFSGELYNNKETIDVKPYTSLELQIDLKVEKFEKDIRVCEGFVNELNLFDLFTVGYYIFPAFIQFQNLKSLNLRKCSVSYSAWCIVNYTLNCLTSLKIDNVTFIVSTIEEFDESKLILGKCLNSLEVGTCNYWITDLPWETTKFIFNTVEDKNHDPVKLPLICIPTLREITFDNHKVQNGWLAKFLILNPQLTSITIDLTEIDQSVINALAKSSNLTELDIQCCGLEPLNNQILEVPNLLSIKTLNIEYVCELSCDFINSLIISCSNLKSLNYSIGLFADCKTVITSFCTKSVPNLRNLNYLSINPMSEQLIETNLRNFTEVEHLELWNCDHIIMNLELPNYPTLLKKLIVLYNGRNFKVEDIKKKFNNFINWKCKFNNDKIVCSKLK
ncbi:hypothetical protein CONCODRAFT_13111, partial [Conidiobolus coronatus NRRL 28638]